MTAWCYHYYGKYSPFADILGENRSSELGQIALDIQDAAVSVRGGGHRRFSVKARHITFSRDRETVIAEGLTDGTLYDNHEHAAARFSGARVVYESLTGSLTSIQNGTVTLTGGVTVSSAAPNGPTLSAGVITWESHSHTVVAPGLVTIVFGNRRGVAVANDVVYDTQTHNLLAHGMRATFHLSPQKDPRNGPALTPGPATAAIDEIGTQPGNGIISSSSDPKADSIPSKIGVDGQNR